jgi:Fur family zinc uptake transcriptional regulator
MSRPALTQNRQAVLDILLQHHEALSAYDILNTLHSADSKWKPATVYRALNFLIEENLIHRVESQQKFIYCDHDHTAHEKLFFICTECGQVSEEAIDTEAIELCKKLAKRKRFALETPYIELRGLCAQCA